MDARPPPLTTVLMLGVSFVALGGLLWLWSASEAPPATDIVVHERIIAPDGHLIFNGSLLLTPGNGTVLGALLRSAEIGGFDVNVTHEYLGRAFVRSIGDYHNERQCGWVYDHNGVRAPRSVDEEVLQDQDTVRWGWDCVG